MSSIAQDSSTIQNGNDSESQFVEGFENDVLLSMLALFVLAATSVYLFFRRDPNANQIHPTLIDAVNDFRRTFHVTENQSTQETAPAETDENTTQPPPQPYNGTEDRICPICYAPSSFAVVTNCGHLFCCNCIYSYWRHSASLVTPVKCAVCRGVVSVLMPLPLEGERERNADEAHHCDMQLNEYNRRFSGQSRAIMDYIRDLPVLLPFMLRTLFSVNGLMWMFRLRVFVCVAAVVIYFLIPFDIIPESALGMLGLLDDVFIAFVVLLYASVLFRELLADGRMRFNWNVDENGGQ